MSGWLKNAEIALGAHSIVFNVCSFTYMFYLGIADATSVRVGNFVGAKQAGHAKLATSMGAACAALMALINGGILILTRWELTKLFTQDEEILHAVADVTICVGTFQLFDSMNSVCAGVFRGLGHQSWGATTNFIGFYVIGLPLGALLCFQFDWGLNGLWFAHISSSCFVADCWVLCCRWGTTIGVGVTSLAAFILTMRINWQYEIKAAADRMDGEQQFLRFRFPAFQPPENFRRLNPIIPDHD